MPDGEQAEAVTPDLQLDSRIDDAPPAPLVQKLGKFRVRGRR